MPVPFASFPFDAAGVDTFAHPIYINAMRAPTSNDIQNPGTRWQNSSVSPPVIYQTCGGGFWGIDVIFTITPNIALPTTISANLENETTNNKNDKNIKKSNTSNEIPKKSNLINETPKKTNLINDIYKKS
jgi:hypothetical protein